MQLRGSDRHPVNLSDALNVMLRMLWLPSVVR